METICWLEDTKKLRKKLSLSITKELIYYESVTYGEYKMYKVTRYALFVNDDIKFNPSINPSLYIELEDGRIIKILNDYFVSMQKPSFIKDMKDLLNKLED